MEQLTVAGHPDPVPASEVAARLLRDRLDAVRSARGEEDAGTLEELIGARLGSLLAGGMPNIDVATMRSVVNYIELPSEDEPEATGLGRTMQGWKDRWAQRGGPAR